MLFIFPKIFFCCSATQWCNLCHRRIWWKWLLKVIFITWFWFSFFRSLVETCYANMIDLDYVIYIIGCCFIFVLMWMTLPQVCWKIWSKGTFLDQNTKHECKARLPFISCSKWKIVSSSFFSIIAFCFHWWRNNWYCTSVLWVFCNVLILTMPT